MIKSEMNILGWHYCDIILITGDAYTAGGKAGQRPDRAAIVYSQRAREAFLGVN
ncbi:MAG: hypothetical protein R8L53_06760 [Mariprofundales bacterium]